MNYNRKPVGFHGISFRRGGFVLITAKSHTRALEEKCLQNRAFES